MKRPLIALIAILALCMPLCDTASEGALDLYYIDGYVVTPTPAGNMPLAKVDVSIKSNLRAYTATSDERGYFNIVVNENSGLYIKFTLSGYSLRACPHVGALGPYHSLDLSKTTFDGVNRYTITSDVKGLQCAIMVQSTSKFTGTVGYGSDRVVGAVVSITPVNTGQLITAETDEKGKFLIECPLGDYTMSVTCNGFKPVKAREITVTENMPPEDILLDRSDVPLYFGMDIAHFMMILGVIFGIAVTITVVILSRISDKPVRFEDVDTDNKRKN